MSKPPIPLYPSSPQKLEGTSQVPPGLLHCGVFTSHGLQTPDPPVFPRVQHLSGARIQGLVRVLLLGLREGKWLSLGRQELACVIPASPLLNSGVPHEMQFLASFTSKYELVGASLIPRKRSKSSIKFLGTLWSLLSPRISPVPCVQEYVRCPRRAMKTECLEQCSALGRCSYMLLNEWRD